MNAQIAEHCRWFAAYVAQERLREEGDRTPIDLKLQHTMRVLANAQKIVTQEAFPSKLERAMLLAALYHDIGRFEQYLRFHTFKDRESVNHGALGAEILTETQCLAGEERWLQEIVVQAVRLHNAFALAQDLDREVALVTKVVRDSDKLDILRIIDGHLSAEKPYNPTVILSLPDDPAVSSPVVIRCAVQDDVASYSDLRSVNDFRLLLATWIHDMNFASSRAEFIRQGHARHIAEMLPTEGVYAEARAHVLAQII